MQVEFTIVFKESDGAYHAYIPEIPGVISCGESIEQAREYVLDALATVLKYRRDEDKADGPATLTERLVLSASVVSETAA